MKFHWEVDHDCQLNRFVFSGDIHLDEFIEAAQEVFRDQSFCPEYNSISDYRQATTHMGPEELEQFRTFTNRSRNHPGRTAVVVTEPWFTMLADLYAFYNTSQRQYKLFYTYESAEAWATGK